MKPEDDILFSPPFDRDAQENKLIALAYRNAEEDLLNRTASAQVKLHFLRLGTLRAKVELEKLELEKRYLEEKIASASAAQDMESMIEEVLHALRSYTVQGEKLYD